MPRFKMPKGTAQGTARRRGSPVLYGEVKKKLNLSLTPTAIDQLAKAAQAENISISEYIERLARSLSQQ